MANAVRRLVSAGNDSAPQVADQARRHLAQRHPALDRLPVAVESAPVVPSATTTLSFGRAPSSNVKDPIAEPRELSAAVAAWLNELLFHCHPANGQPVERFHEDLLRERRHMFQGAGLFETLHWKLFA